MAAFCEAQRNRAERSSPVADLSDHKFTTCGQTIFMQLGHNTERSLTFWRNIRNIQVRNLGSTSHYRVNCCLRQFGQFRFGKTIAHYYHWRPEKRKIFQNVSPKWSIILVCDDCMWSWWENNLFCSSRNSSFFWFSHRKFWFTEDCYDWFGSRKPTLRTRRYIFLFAFRVID